MRDLNWVWYLHEMYLWNCEDLSLVKVTRKLKKMCNNSRENTGNSTDRNMRGEGLRELVVMSFHVSMQVT